MKIKMLVVIFVSWPFWGSFVFAATQAQIDQSWNKALAWIMTNQQSDGGWGNTAGLGPQTTGEIIKALASINLNSSYTYLGGVSWLSNAESASVDALAHQTEALKVSGQEITPFATKLLSWQNEWKGWGAYPQYASSLPDTALAIMTLMDTQGDGYNSDDIAWAACQFLPAQLPSPNSLWPYSVPPVTMEPSGQQQGAIVPTVYAVQALDKINTSRFTGITCGSPSPPYSLTTVINNAISGLLQKRKSDNGFGDGTTSTIQETALVYRVLKTLRPTDPATSPALDFLIAQQAGNGSWGSYINGSWVSDIFSTALVLASLPAPTPLIDTDKDGIPDGVETILGKMPGVADSRFLAAGSSPSITALLTLLTRKANDSSLSTTAVLAQASVAGVKTGTGDPKATSFPNEPLDLEVFVAGSSAQLAVFEVVVNSLFRKDIPVEIFHDDDGVPGQIQGGNYRAYLGTVGTTGSGQLDGKRVLIHFRGKGGSYYGVGPVAQASAIEHMVINEGCIDPDGDHYWSCPLKKTVVAVPDAGISEVHPAWHIGKNVPHKAGAPSAAALDRLDIAPIFQGFFGVAATKALLNSGFDRLNREEATALLAGLVSEGWSEIDPSLPQKPVMICRMADGSQPATNALFFNFPCDPEAAPARNKDALGVQSTVSSGPNLLVIENNSFHNLINCLNTANSGGLLVQSNPARRVQVPANSFAIGVLPSSYQPEKTDQWGYLSIDDTVDHAETQTVSGAGNLATNFWMQWRKDAAAGQVVTSGDTLALLKEIRARLQNPELLKAFPGVKALPGNWDGITESCKGGKQ